MLSNRITENNRALMAAAAMVNKMMSRSKPRVLRPVSPLKKRSAPVPESVATTMLKGSLEGERWTAQCSLLSKVSSSRDVEAVLYTSLGKILGMRLDLMYLLLLQLLHAPPQLIFAFRT